MPGKMDVRVTEVALYFLPIETRVPLKFGPETLTSVTIARASVRVAGAAGWATGWGETPLSVQWVWPSALPYEERHEALKAFSIRLAGAWSGFEVMGHPMEIGHDFLEQRLPSLLEEFNRGRAEPIPLLAALVCCSSLDLAIHDAFGMLHRRPTYTTYTAEFMNRDLATYLVADAGNPFVGHYPVDYLTPPPRQLDAWHLVGGKDPIDEADLDGSEPNDGYPVLLADWVRRDGLRCLKVKLRGDDAAWDFARLRRVDAVAFPLGVNALSADFNCTVRDPEYVNEILDRIKADLPELFDRILYVEQPFPYDLEEYAIDVYGVSARKPLFMDESAHDWRLVRMGRGLGWTGVALKTCKTQTGALLSLCWAREHGMALMVQDLTNPMLAQIPHLLLAAHAGTIRGVETNAMQFYPEASRPEAAIHPGVYARKDGRIDVSSLLEAPGFGYGEAVSARELPGAVFG